MIKKRDNFLFFIPVLVGLIVLISTALLMFNLKQFSSSYIAEAKDELNIELKQVLWIITPMLEKKQFSNIKKYFDEFKDDRIRITLVNKNGVVLTDSKAEVVNFVNHSNRPEIQHSPSTIIRYSSTMGTDMVYHSTPLNVNGENYIVRVSASAINISKMLNIAERNIVLTFSIGIILVLLMTGYIMVRVRIPFNKLQDSAIKIANGDMETEIFIPDGGMLYELSRAFRVMSKQLKRQIKNMKKMESFRSEFIANVSHEVKTPLTSILSAVEILNDNGMETPQSKKCLKIISEQSNRLNRLIQDILSLADLEKKQILKNRDFSQVQLSSVIQNSVSLCSGLLDGKDIELIIEQNDDIKVFVNSHLLEQAIINLVANSVKYSKTDRIVINSMLFDGEVRISVKDYGIGIPKEHSSRVFERFYRVDKARSREVGGTGLGLAIVKNIAKLHNGTIELISNSGEGAEFIICIPYI